ncbi:MAG: carbamoyl-phosphate synthase ATP-binding subunit [Moraxellaceae bacterium]|nr:carbamoyl-phosphate synthase ATP-binding subunit [Moraxellaceae bacterium]
MRAVHEEREFIDALHAAQREARNAFGDERMLIEKLLVEPRHVDVQVLADRQGNAVYVFDRDCSIQRRHQKVVEEAPAPGLDDALRRAMGEAAVRAAKAIAYEGAGTLEFLVDRHGDFYFMEMNTRLQVEHPVTELISGLDLVELQLRIASGEPLPFAQSDLSPRGHAMEVRLYAEDPYKEFLPSTGILQRFELPAPEGGRVDTGYRSGDAVSVYYDPMMAKVIAWGETRDVAVEHLCNALRQVRIAGVKHNARFLTQVLSHPAFRRAELGTHFIEEHRAGLFTPLAVPVESLLLLAAQLFLRAPDNSVASGSPWSQLQGFRISAPDVVLLRVKLGEEVHGVQLTPEDDGFRYRLGNSEGRCSLRHAGGNSYLVERDGHSQSLTAERKGDAVHVFRDGEHVELVHVRRTSTGGQGGDEHHYRAPMNGRIVSVNVKAGDSVQKGDTLLVMEAMKMEYRIRAHAEGVVASVAVTAGDLVSEGQDLVDL